MTRTTDLLTIGQVGRAVGVATSTLRYYERAGILPPTVRNGAGYRFYDTQALGRLQFIRAAQAAGFTLADIVVLLHFRNGDVAPCKDVQELISARLERVAEQIEQLTRVDQLLRKWLQLCRRTERSGKCGVLAGLSTPDKTCCEKNPKNP